MAGDGAIRSTEDAMWAGHQVFHIPGREETSVAGALEGLAAHGHCTEEAWPYGAPRYPAERPATAREPANQRALPPWRTLPVTLEAIRTELERPSAVVLSLRVVRTAWRVAGGVIDAPAGRKTPGNHAALVVGMMDQPARIIIKNSWGEHWGAAGYGFITERYLTHYGLRAHILEISNDTRR
jgi:C1A family cysteine protease